MSYTTVPVANPLGFFTQPSGPLVPSSPYFLLKLLNLPSQRILCITFILCPCIFSLLPSPPTPKFSTSARCLENCTHPLRCSSTAPSSQLSWSPEGASQRACGNSFLTATPILTVPSGCCLGYPGTRGKQNGQHRFQLVYTLGFHLRLFLKDGQSSIKRRKVWIWLSSSKLPWCPYTKLPFPSRCSKHLLKSALETVPGAVWWSFCLLCTSISHLKKADNLVPASSLWVHLLLTTQSFIYLTDLYGHLLCARHCVQCRRYKAKMENSFLLEAHSLEGYKTVIAAFFYIVL